MKEADFEKIVGGLGKNYSQLVANGALPEAQLKAPYPESDSLYFEPEEGIEFAFEGQEKTFVQFSITLKKTTPHSLVYKDQLPEFFLRDMNQKQVHDFFGEPVKYQPPMQMPLPVGLTGGWDDYIYDAELFPGVTLEFQYTADMEVDTIVFFHE